jgi:hypothetical protein
MPLHKSTDVLGEFQPLSLARLRRCEPDSRRSTHNQYLDLRSEIRPSLCRWLPELSWNMTLQFEQVVYSINLLVYCKAV